MRLIYEARIGWSVNKSELVLYTTSLLQVVNSKVNNLLFVD